MKKEKRRYLRVFEVSCGTDRKPVRLALRAHGRIATRDVYARFRFSIGFAQMDVALTDYRCFSATTTQKLA
ncbi:hypothetical protein [Caballeronia sp. LjRoot31]|uniref:hypothetical protein n=1 Tax=Caballeronia sp. LjRoot31 TaxID=3342324 RepID=UPI003ED09D2A